MATTGKRAAIYARVSTAEQVDGTSLATQVERCEHHIAAQGWTATGTYIDEGVSGAKASRPALDRLLLAVRGGAVDAIVIAKLDRVGRSMRHLATLLGELDDRGVALVSVSEAFDSTTASGRLQRNMLGSFAEFEREMIRDRMVAGRDAAVRNGKWASRHAPYGFKADPPAYILELVPHEADALRTMVDLFVNHRLSTAAIARELNARGHAPRSSPAWTAWRVRWCLRSSDHLGGTFTWRRPGRGYSAPPIVVAGPALLDAALLQRLQDRVAATANSYTHHPERYLLAGRIVTPHGTPMYGFCSRTPLYRCSDTFNATAPPGGRTCTCNTLRVETTDAAVWAEVVALLSDPARLLAMAGLHLDAAGQAARAADDLAALDRRITRLENAAGDRLSTLLAAGLDPAVAAHAARNLTDELDAARTRRQQLLSWQAATADRTDRATGLLRLVDQARHNLPTADHTTKTRTLELLDVRVRVDNWTPCPTCNGTGWISKWADSEARRAGRRRGEFPGLVCPACQRHRHIPHLTIDGTVPTADLDTPTTDDPARRLPFTVINATG